MSNLDQELTTKLYNIEAVLNREFENVLTANLETKIKSRDIIVSMFGKKIEQLKKMIDSELQEMAESKMLDQEFNIGLCTFKKVEALKNGTLDLEKVAALIKNEKIVESFYEKKVKSKDEIQKVMQKNYLKIDVEQLYTRVSKGFEIKQIK